MTRLGPVFILAAFVFLLMSGCLPTDQKAGQNLKVAVNTNAESTANAGVPSGGDIIELGSYEFIEGLLDEEIKEISLKPGLEPLSKTVKSERFEFRLWKNPSGRGREKLLIVRSDRRKNNAYFFDMNRRVKPIEVSRQHLLSPKSGWDKMLYELRNRLTTPKGLVRDPNFRVERDEPLILLELLDKGEYRRVFYGQNTSFPDGKRLIDVCDYLASEFGVNMDCRGERNPP